MWVLRLVGKSFKTCGVVEQTHLQLRIYQMTTNLSSTVHPSHGHRQCQGSMLWTRLARLGAVPRHIPSRMSRPVKEKLVITYGTDSIQVCLPWSVDKTVRNHKFDKRPSLLSDDRIMPNRPFNKVIDKIVFDWTSLTFNGIPVEARWIIEPARRLTKEPKVVL
jgi:hypothetical protein